MVQRRPSLLAGAFILTGWTLLFPFYPVHSIALLALGVIVMGLAFADGISKLRFRWKHLEILGGILVMSGMLMVLPGCPIFGLFPPIIYGQCDLSTFVAGIGFFTSVAGTVLFVSGEVGRRKKSSVAH